VGQKDARPQVEAALRYIDLAAEVGCPLIRVFAGNGGETRVVIESLRKIAPHATARGVTVCLESHDSHTDPKMLARVMSEVDHPNAGILWDVMHTQRQARFSMAEAHALLKPWIRHVHVHDGLNRLDVLRMVPMGSGDLDHRAVFALLKRSGYAGYVSGEWIAGCMDEEFFATHLETEIAALRRIEGEIG